MSFKLQVTGFFYYYFIFLSTAHPNGILEKQIYDKKNLKWKKKRKQSCFGWPLFLSHTFKFERQDS